MDRKLSAYKMVGNDDKVSLLWVGNSKSGSNIFFLIFLLFVKNKI